MKNAYRLSIAGLLTAVSLSVAQTPKLAATVNGENITVQQVEQAVLKELLSLSGNRPKSQAAYDRARLELL